MALTRLSLPASSSPMTLAKLLLCCSQLLKHAAIFVTIAVGIVEEVFPQEEQFWFHLRGAGGNVVWWCHSTPPGPKGLETGIIHYRLLVSKKSSEH